MKYIQAFFPYRNLTRIKVKAKHKIFTSGDYYFSVIRIPGSGSNRQITPVGPTGMLYRFLCACASSFLLHPLRSLSPYYK
jgi:hypothetical protein